MRRTPKSFSENATVRGYSQHRYLGETRGRGRRPLGTREGEGYSRTAWRMVSDDPSTTVNESNVAAESTVGGKKNQSRVPKKIHKAEREKLKRDQLNELFLEDDHNQTDKTIVRLPYWVILPEYSDISSRIYQWATHMAVATERNELKDENTTLQAEISQLQKELQGRSRSNPTWSDNINSMTPTQPQPTAKGLTMLQHFSGGKKKHSTTNAAWAPSQVMRPHARCPTSSDLQPGLLLWTSHQDHKNRDVAAVALALAARRKDVLKHQLVVAPIQPQPHTVEGPTPSPLRLNVRARTGSRQIRRAHGGPLLGPTACHFHCGRTVSSSPVPAEDTIGQLFSTANLLHKAR
ncbi:hypothetical protein C4D60_Mb02t09090 [Musa balbisiana]|uniref:Iron-related transcription factor 3 bHLH domain-containing protein n=1 Tax=Musa balbisiana TaxID=52838 RepID=A0A4S8I9J7_MUSBA|nr:hypothetical protein C4D60_Mb02t09090 [Musa balbisiana]